MSFGYTVLGFGSGSSSPYIAATGGNIATSGDYKIHTFNSSGTFTVTNAGDAAGSNAVEYLVIAGAGGGGGGDADDDEVAE